MRTLIMPCAGLGTRFTEAGFEQPKPLIVCDGEHALPMFLMATLPFIKHVDNIVYVVLEEHVDRFVEFIADARDDMLILNTNIRVASITHVQAGAALSVLAAIGQLSDADEVIVANCDQFFTGSLAPWFELLGNFEGSILTFKRDSGPWSYVQLDEDGFVEKVVEKEPISGTATAGVYYFKSWALLRDCICAQQSDLLAHTVKGELYVAPLFNEFCRESDNTVTVFDVEEHNCGWYCVGTPKLLAEWEELQEKLYAGR